MAHYTVTVVVQAETEQEAEAAVEAALDPFSEHFEVEPYEQDIEPVEVERALAWADEQRQQAGEPVLDRSDVEAVAAAVADWEGRDVERRGDGSYFYRSTYNPDGHWDWWVIGGRWADRFQLTDGHRGDLARVRDVDLASMREQAVKDAEAAYDEFEEATAGLAVPPRWAELLERHGRANIEAARAEFNSDPWVKAARRWLDDPHEFWCVGAEDPRAEFVGRAVAGVGVPYAWLQDGCWEQQGYIGMFMAMAPDEVAAVDRWAEEVAAKWASLDRDLWVANVDCHT